LRSSKIIVNISTFGVIFPAYNEGVDARENGLLPEEIIKRRRFQKSFAKLLANLTKVTKRYIEKIS
jgi:hypothetical protein